MGGTGSSSVWQKFSEAVWQAKDLILNFRKF